jgi:NADPH-dependent 2,4-dienoyl-CoA reductase/sulfur reductase-like enzyme
MDAIHNILIVGGGPAGSFAAMTAKTHNPAATVTLVTSEGCEPYEKPPLSKGVLLGKVMPGDAPIAGPGGLAAFGVELTRGAECVSIDRTARTIVLSDGRRLVYDRLVLATGSRPREIPELPLGTPSVHYLRSHADADNLKAALRRSRRLLVVGGGLIGLEVAAAAAELGVQTTVLEVANRILPRVCDPATAALVHDAHRQHGVDIRVDTRKIEARVQPEGFVEISTDEGLVLTPDVIVVGTGAAPDDRLAAAAGLVTDDGIVVDEHCRTSDPLVYAAGDAVRFPGPHGPVRLENWRHAQDQGAVAGRNAAGSSDAYVTVPSFWSEQYDLYIQGVGWRPGSGAHVRRPLPGKSALVFNLEDGRIAYAMGVNAQRDLAMARRLIERGIVVDPAALADADQPLAKMLKP